MKIALVTGSRADYGIVRSTALRLAADPRVELELLVTGSHLEIERGETWREIERDGLPITATIPLARSRDDAEAIARATGDAVGAFAAHFATRAPDWLVLTGDRYEMFAAALAALFFRIPVAHLHGGERSEGSLDESLRHALTKLAHLHFVSHDLAARRVIQLGEAPWRVHVSGAPALEALESWEPWPREALLRALELASEDRFLVVSYHAPTLQADESPEIEALLAAIARYDGALVLSAAGADAAGDRINARLTAFARSHPRARFVASLGRERYFSALSHADALVGNSSSGILEAASLGCPVVNLGDRQRGRWHGESVLDATPADLVDKIEAATSPEFRARCRSLPNPYHRRNASRLIVDALMATPRDERLVVKAFHDWVGNQTV